MDSPLIWLLKTMKSWTGTENSGLVQQEPMKREEVIKKTGGSGDQRRSEQRKKTLKEKKQIWRSRTTYKEIRELTTGLKNRNAASSM